MLLQPPPKDWECPRCTVTERTGSQIQNRFHQCAGLAGLDAPLVAKGSGARLVVVEWEDYVGDELAHVNGDGRPITAVRVERPDGSNDTVAYPATARGKAV